MRDFTHKQIALRTARAIGVVFCSSKTIAAIRNNELENLDLFAGARAAGFLGAKATHQLLPHRHQVHIEGLQLNFEFLQEGSHAEFFEESTFKRSGIVINAEAKAIGRAGIAMETLTAVSVAALELYDLLQSFDQELEIGHVRLVEKKGYKTDRKKFFSTSPVCAVLVCSDSTAAGQREDQSGKIITQMLEEVNAQVKHYAIVPDEKYLIQQQIRKWVAEDVQFIFTTGGTGLGPRDNTVSAVKEIIDRDADGIAEAMRSYGQMRTPLAMMSRGVAGAIEKTLIVTLPGSSSGARESLQAILPAVFHARKMMKGGGH